RVTAVATGHERARGRVHVPGERLAGGRHLRAERVREPDRIADHRAEVVLPHRRGRGLEGLRDAHRRARRRAGSEHGRYALPPARSPPCPTGEVEVWKVFEMRGVEPAGAEPSITEWS